MFLKYREGRLFRFGYYLLGSFIIILFNFIGQIPLVVSFTSSMISDNIEISPESNPMELLNIIPANLRLFLILLPFAISFLGFWLVIRKLHEQTMTSVTTSRNTIDWNRIIFAFSVWAVITSGLICFDYIVDPEGYKWNFKPLPFLFMFLISLLFIPIQTSLEEYVFRGYLMQGFANLFRNRWMPLLLTSFIFGSLHIANPEIAKLGYGLLGYYIGTGLFLGIITLLDDGIELALGFHAANNLVGAILVTADWTAFQTNSILISIAEPNLYREMFVSLFFFYPILLFVFARKYKWKNGFNSLTARI